MPHLAVARFVRAPDRALEALSAAGGWSVAIVAALLAAYVAFKALHRARLRKLYRAVRIDAAEMAALMATEPGLLVLDARSEIARVNDARVLPNAMWFNHESELELLPPDSHERTLITFCTCPNEASAALLADRWLKAGYTRVRVLAGGEEALAYLEGTG